MKSGINEIAIERKEQIEKHGWSLENDQYYSRGQLGCAAKYALMSYTGIWPPDWDPYFKVKVDKKPLIERLRVAGALIAAEIDRLLLMEQNYGRGKGLNTEGVDPMYGFKGESTITTEEEINNLIKTLGVDTNLISDGYHTFGELYEHRIVNFMTLCYWVYARCSDRGNDPEIWRSKAHSDGSVWDGWFILGINKRKGEQITYHLPMSKWDECDRFYPETLDRAPEWDGHTSADVLERLKNL